MPQNVTIIPFGKRNGAWSIDPVGVVALFERMQREGTARWAFPSRPDMTAQDFVCAMSGERQRLFLVLNGSRAGGVFWLNNLADRSCWVHFCVFKEAWGNQAETMGRVVLKHLLETRAQEGRYWIDCVVGVVADNNRLARNYAQRVGMRRAGKVPGMIFDGYLGRSVPACIFYATREDR